jgi:eukaryotic-like serine/threonine-protein kinase
MTADLAEPLCLAAQARIASLRDSSEDELARLGAEASDYLITTPGLRATSKVVDEDTAVLVSMFAKPRTLSDVVAVFSHVEEQRADAILKAVLPMIASLVADGILCSPTLLDETLILRPGDTIDGTTVARIIQSADDSLVAQVDLGGGIFGALKIARSPDATAEQRLSREVATLLRLDGEVGPRLLSNGLHGGRRFLITEWVAGIAATSAAEEYRALSKWAELSQLLIATTASYASLHQRGVVHGDLHPGNLLVDGALNVALIDFGLAAISDSQEYQGGIAFFAAPEYIRRDGSATISPSEPNHRTMSCVSEQYSLGALLWLLATGEHYLDFRLDRAGYEQQVTTVDPREFGPKLRGHLSELEPVLRRALAKEPARRWPTTEALLGAVRSALKTERHAAAPGDTERLGSSVRPQSRQRVAQRADLLAQLDPTGPVWERGLDQPTASLAYGATGIALLLRRMAVSSSRPELLDWATAWGLKAAHDAGRPGGFSGSEEFDPSVECPSSMYHGQFGLRFGSALLHAGRAAFESARRDAAGLADLIRDREISRKSSDLYLGDIGRVVGVTCLIDEEIRDEAVESATRDLLGTVWHAIETEPEISSSSWRNLGLAHGWAGALYAGIRWVEATGDPLPVGLIERLDQLWGFLRPVGRGVAIPWRDGGSDREPTSGWCNGSAGLVHLAAAAARVLDNDRSRNVIEPLAWHAWESGPGPTHLCCGLAGRAEALLSCAGETGDHRWAQRAARLVDSGFDQLDSSAVDPCSDDRPHSLAKGNLGLLAVGEQLERSDSWGKAMLLNF